jgi:hypothetical protein
MHIELSTDELKKLSGKEANPALLDTIFTVATEDCRRARGWR